MAWPDVRSATVGRALKWRVTVARLSLAIVPITALAVTSCSSVEPVDAPREQDVIVVGSADTPESAIVAELYAGALARTGASVRTALELGERTAYLNALDSGRITLVPEQSGAYLAYLHPSADVTDADDVYQELNRSLPEGISVSDYAMAEIPAQSAQSASAAPADGSADETPAQNVLPVFRTGELTDDQVRRLNIVAGELTTAGLAELTDAFAAGEPSGDVARSWLDVHGL
jgi:glycine betaine/choline ABC-type transport system substrate-binding protein